MTEQKPPSEDLADRAVGYLGIDDPTGAKFIDRVIRMHRFIDRKRAERIAEIMNVDVLDFYGSYLGRLMQGELLPPLLIDAELVEKLTNGKA